MLFYSIDHVMIAIRSRQAGELPPTQHYMIDMDVREVRAYSSIIYGPLGGPRARRLTIPLLSSHLEIARSSHVPAQLNEIVATCERLFSSPIPPNMARHGMRSLVLWLLLLPLVMSGAGVPPLGVALCAATTSYIYLGIDELGVQVEQPFKILPLWVRSPLSTPRHFGSSPLPPLCPSIPLPCFRRGRGGGRRSRLAAIVPSRAIQP